MDPATLGLAPAAPSDFTAFLNIFKAIVQRLHGPEDYARITQSLLKSLIAQGVDYAEITLSAGVILWKSQDLHRVYEAIRQVCLRNPEIRVQWCFDAVRQFGAAAAQRVVDVAGELTGEGVVSFGIGGDEVAAPASLFAEAYKRAHAHGLRLTAHAGETDGPASVWDALRIGAERIGHGIRAIDDAALVRHLRDRQIPLEVCITSNVITGAVPNLDAHPVRRLFDAGVPLTLNTDDPGIFETTLAREFSIARERFGFTEAELAAIAANAYRFAF